MSQTNTVKTINWFEVDSGRTPGFYALRHEPSPQPVAPKPNQKQTLTTNMQQPEKETSTKSGKGKEEVPVIALEDTIEVEKLLLRLINSLKSDLIQETMRQLSLENQAIIQEKMDKLSNDLYQKFRELEEEQKQTFLSQQQENRYLREELEVMRLLKKDNWDLKETVNDLLDFTMASNHNITKVKKEVKDIKDMKKWNSPKMVDALAEYEEMFASDARGGRKNQSPYFFPKSPIPVEWIDMRYGADSSKRIW